MNAFRDAWAVLKKEPECWLAYLHGQQLEHLPQLTQRPPRHRGVTKRLLILVYQLFRGTKLTSRNYKHADFLFYASTSNQVHSLESTLMALRDRNQSVTLVSSNTDSQPFEFHPFSGFDLLIGLALILIRLPALWRQTRNKHPALRTSYFDVLCYGPIYLVHFRRILRRYNPRSVVVANDHSVNNRCLLAMAHHLGLATAYCQHASVSPLFPPLRVNVALLDGSAALETYRQCEVNQLQGCAAEPRPHIFLSGQKKVLFITAQGEAVGFAVNALDEPDSVVALIYALKGYPLKFRWHPRQAPEEVIAFKEALAETGHDFSDPSQEKVCDFLEGLRFLIAGDSSIHLEAALALVQPIYYRLTSVGAYDYYGYVAADVAREAKNLDELTLILNSGSTTNTPELSTAVRYYSHTFGTEWFGREGELAAKVLMNIHDEVSYNDLPGYSGQL